MYVFAAVALVSFLAIQPRLCADAFVVTRAMRASTIAEIFVQRDRIRVELEVGSEDVSAFANCLPDNLHASLTGNTAPLETRLPAFFDSDWVMVADGKKLPGTLTSLSLAKRVVRDEVTGEALAEQPEDAENVVRITLEYLLDSNALPEVLRIQPGLLNGEASPSIGFVCYHDQLPVNDFRFLADSVTLDLDWLDPWYSRFRHPNLRRQFDSPLSIYLYVEPYEVRKEIIVRPIDLMGLMDAKELIDLNFNQDGWIRVSEQDALKQQVADYLISRNPMTIDGQVIKGKLDRIHFIQRSLRTTGIIEPPVDLRAVTATLGVIFVYPIDQLPQKVSLTCDLFTPRIRTLPVVASDEAGGLPGKVTPENPELVWKNYLTNPGDPGLIETAAPPERRTLSVPVASVVLVCLAIAFGSSLGMRSSAQRYASHLARVASLACFAFAVLLLPFAKVSIARPFTDPPKLTEQDAKSVLSSLLYNVYRSFDHHDESLIYDRLGKSIDGDLLREVYLETRESIEIKNQGSMRISVKEVSVLDLEPAEANGPYQTYRCRWRVSGWIGHWGHVHARENEHIAFISIADRDSRWKITEMQMLDPSAVPTAVTSVETEPDNAR